MKSNRLSSNERNDWAVELEKTLLVGGASFSEWATLMSFEAHQCFVSGADISTIVVCAATVETFLRTELYDFKSRLVDLIDRVDIDDALVIRLHALRQDRNKWLHSSQSMLDRDLSCYTEIYNETLENSAKEAYHTMLCLLLSDQFV